MPKVAGVTVRVGGAAVFPQAVVGLEWCEGLGGLVDRLKRRLWVAVP